MPSDSLHLPASQPPRVLVDAVMPTVDGGRRPAKCTVGDLFTVHAHLVADGHDLVTGMLMIRPDEGGDWVETPLESLGNDEYRARVIANEVGRYRYVVEAWIDAYRSWAADLERRVLAGWDVTSELPHGAQLAAEAAGRASWPDGGRLHHLAERLGDDAVPAIERASTALEADHVDLVSRYPDRTSAARGEGDLPLVVDPERARFGAWYEMFPRSAGNDPSRSATFREAAARLPDIAAMGFDVLYLPPVHPIGSTKRKGRNNALEAAPGDPGSPWAIGSDAGGHTAVHPDLGTIDDFDWFVREAEAHGLAVALDIAFQCSPDHPWVREHPEWFRHRPDGSIKYAENPPKRYEDVYPLDFDTPDWRALWTALLEVFRFWMAHGVTIFRVDNPHTKPFPFWEWLIAEVKRERPEAMFLAEAFTRPKRMQALAKLGFDQSYTYFTWRNTKQELTEYFTELSTPPVADFLRPNLFANTPDILHEYLQVGGRPAFLVRAVLAATLGPTWGIYSGYELCEGDAVPGTEEYADSEKYEIRVRDWDAPANIKAEITRLNEVRRTQRALQFTRDLWFLPVENDQLIAYMKQDPHGGGHVLVVVNLDVTGTQSGYVGLPMEALGLRADEQFVVHDTLNDRRHLWHGEWNFVRLDPRVEVAHVFVFEGPTQTEREVEAYR
ncbi:MAG: alpha-1,4-glucan--maltose-1-phosphate maltosyltransferase [Dehalococcoidia bacterium]